MQWYDKTAGQIEHRRNKHMLVTRLNHMIKLNFLWPCGYVKPENFGEMKSDRVRKNVLHAYPGMHSITENICVALSRKFGCKLGIVLPSIIFKMNFPHKTELKKGRQVS